MTTVSLHSLRSRLRQLGVAGVLFFTVKGLLWLCLPALLALLAG